MREDSKYLLKKLLEYRDEVGNDFFKYSCQHLEEIPNINYVISDILEDLISNNCIARKSKIIDAKGNILVYLTLDGIKYFESLGNDRKKSDVTYVIRGQQINIANNTSRIEGNMNTGIQNMSNSSEVEESNILLTDIFDLLQQYMVMYIENVVCEAELSNIESNKEKSIIEIEKNRVIKKLHNLIDSCEDSTFIISKKFYVFIELKGANLIRQLLENNSHIMFNKTDESQVKSLFKLYDEMFYTNNHLEKSFGINFLKRFFEVCFRFKINLFMSLMQGNVKYILGYKLNDSLLLEINDDIENVLDIFQKVYDRMELNKVIVQMETKDDTLFIDGKKTVEIFSENYEKPLIFEDASNAKKLKDVFVWPEYKSSLLDHKQDDLEQLINTFLKGSLKLYLFDKGISKLKLDKAYNLLLILGMGGMGKSSLLEKIAYDVLHSRKKLKCNGIYFAKFSDMECKFGNLLENITTFLGIDRKMLENSILVLDAFDEYILDDIDKQKMIESFCHDIRVLNCRTIITSRENYIDTKDLENCFVIKLLTFNVYKRKEWLNKYNKSLPLKIEEDICNYHDENDLDGEEFIGIPIIIYMVASNCIKISEYNSKFEFYDALFGENGVWCKRIYDIRHPALFKKNREMFNLVLNIAETMFQKNKTSIQYKEIEQIIKDSINQEDIGYIQNWYGIITYFKKNKLSEIEFAHKSIFEYYVTYGIFNKLLDTINETYEVEKLKMLQGMFKRGTVTKEMLYFLDGFIEKKIDDIQFESIENTIRLMISSNILFNSQVKFNSLNELYNYFYNALNCLVRMLSKKSEENLIDILDQSNQGDFSFFLRNKEYDYIYMRHFDLSSKNFSRVLFRNVDLLGSDMRNSDFSYCDFSNANLEKCNFSGANLFCATLSNTNLSYADLRGSNLNNTIFKKDRKFFLDTKIYIYQLKYFWPEITTFYHCFQVYVNDSSLATQKDIESEFDKIRGFHLKIWKS